MNNKEKFQAALLALLISSSTMANACLTNENENNDTEGTANAGVCSGVTVAGSLSRSDTDWFSLNVSEAGNIDISLDHNSRDDFDWFLYGETGAALAQAETSNYPETGSYQISQPGTYFIKVTRYKGTGWYELDTNFADSGSGGGNTSNCAYGDRPSKPGTLKAWTLGDTADSCAELSTGAALLMGGGSDVDAAFSNRVAAHIGSGKDVVVLRTSGTDAYNDYLLSLLNADSVETLIIDTRSKANDAYVDWAIRSAEFVWVSGGDQSDYLNQWQGTKVQSALQHVYDKGGVVGGTSAGMALMAASVYDPDGVSGAVSSEVVTDFCHNTLQFGGRFINIPVLDNSLTDTHFQQRDRMGRAAVSLGHHANNYFNIAASEGTSIFITADGEGVINGDGEVYVLRETNNTIRQQLSCGSAVSYQNILRTKLIYGDSYNFNNHSHTGTDIEIDINGSNNNFYNPTNPY